MGKSYDAVIIGAGIIGTSIAFELAKKAYRTLNVDKLGTAGAGSTVNTCAVIRTHYSTLDGTAMAYESYLHWKRWPQYLGVADECGHARLYDVGVVILHGEDHDMSRHIENHRKLGIPIEIWDLDTVKERMPFIDTSAYYPPRRPDDADFGKLTGKSLSGAIYLPGGGYINDPQLSVHNLQRAAEAHGAEFRFREEVEEIRRRHGRVVGIGLAGGETMDAPVVVNAAGPHSFIVNELAGVDRSMKISTRALRHEVHYLPAPDGYDLETNGWLISDDDVGGYARPEAGDKILIGSQDPECDPKEWVDDPDDFNRQVTGDQWQAQVYRMAQRIPGLPIPGQAQGIVDLYDVSDDWIPIYDKSDLGGFYMAVGTSGNQYKNGPVAGLLMAEVIDACEHGHDHDADPVQVNCPITGFTLDAGFYSRNRDIVEGSSFSVLG
jgi:sarcosine oxidase subunit beta